LNTTPPVMSEQNHVDKCILQKRPIIFCILQKLPLGSTTRIGERKPKKMSCCSVSFRSYWRFNVKFGNLMTKHGYSFRLCCFRKSVVLRCGYSLRARRQGALAQQLPRAARSSEYSSEDLCFLVDFGWLLVFSSLFPSQKVQKEFKLEFAKRHFCG